MVGGAKALRLKVAWAVGWDQRLKRHFENIGFCSERDGAAAEREQRVRDLIRLMLRGRAPYWRRTGHSPSCPHELMIQTREMRGLTLHSRAAFSSVEHVLPSLSSHPAQSLRPLGSRWLFLPGATGLGRTV